MPFTTVNPATGETIATWETMPAAQVMEIADRTHAAFHTWREVPIADRAPYFRRLAGVLRDTLVFGVLAEEWRAGDGA